MFTADYSLYIGKESEDFLVDFITTDTFFLSVGINRPVDEAEVDDLLSSIRKAMIGDKPQNLQEFQKVIEDYTSIWESRLSYSAGLMLGKVIYFVTKGMGEVFIVRGGRIFKLIDGNNSSSGYIADGDFFILTHENFSSRVSLTELHDIIVNASPEEAAKELTQHFQENDGGTGALLVQFYKMIGDEVMAVTPVSAPEPLEGQPEMETVTAAVPMETPIPAPAQPMATQVEPIQSDLPKESFLDRIKKKIASGSMQGGMMGSSRGKMLTFGIVVILAGVFIWSVVLGNQRREKNAFVQRVTEQATTVDAKLQEAKDIAGLNPQKSLENIAEAKQIVASLTEEAQKKKFTGVTQLDNLKSAVAQTEKSIKKSESAHVEEFFDASLISKDATISKMFLSEDTIALLDKEHNRVYALSVPKKSTDTFKSGRASKAEFIAMHQGEPFIFVPNEGIFKVTEEKEEKVIAKDDEWGNITDFQMYSGNIYLLDAGKETLDKYLVASNGYSEKKTYFTGSVPDLADATALTIDSNVYIAAGSNVYKFTAGIKSDYTLNLPYNDLTFEDIFTSKDIDFVYLLDKDNGAIFVTTKTGEFKKQLSADVIKKAEDIVVFEDTILVLADNKLYQIKD